ncbi:phosphate acyltransferase PlsX [Weissella diestrammenae]|uniref:Phosphate acyltransferase n=1 Tax=Weissella diestrammenae TaxID=1162633 RepID=A0A7G9T541_9LACO|nr:phosphate acyltransferase PlsX [Weissella diestrammenae]MCM0583071.1 phosphate acyltransferase PlsX [Weissella diestrammenae]QNN75216.1 phosphate acyltransferase PlsX [Weissella diestrammenae]
MFKIAVDAMGGDNAPEAIVQGIEIARDSLPNVEFLLYGQTDKVLPLIQDDTRISVMQADDVIAMADEPVKSVRSRKQSSLVLAANAVKSGQADALFSAGNTGALLAAGIFLVGRIKGISRPALMTVLPAMAGDHDSFVMMDVGANAENRATHLYEYGILGSFYAKEILGYSTPRVGLLNNGGEEDKGDAVHKEAHQLLKSGSAAGFINFIGNVESREILQGPADVVVADGFSGNATLKAIEGTALSLMKMIKQTIMNAGVIGKLGGAMLKPALKQVAGRLDPEQYGGAVVLGVKAPVVKTHGASGPEAVAGTMRQINTMLETQLIEKVETFVSAHKDDLAARETEE